MHATQSDGGGLRIGVLAARAGTSADTVRYYERLGLLGPPPRTASGYRIYQDEELRRLQFIRRAKRLGFSLDDIRGLLGLAEEGECRPLRRQVAELLRREIVVCETKLTEIAAFKATLETYHQLAVQGENEPACSCASFPATCACLPIQIQEDGPWRR
ncbi:MAG: MerR family transcriptional regulator [Acidobacteria bacterium]|nr:MerR family transcriptional regulator [Acidobacteriota bacterium]